jgi:hypothetical protein
VQVPGQDPAHIGGPEHGGQPAFLAELDPAGHRDRARDRRMVQGQQGAVRCRPGQDVPEPDELIIGEFAVVLAGHGRIEDDDAQAAEQVHPVHRFLGGFGVQQPGSERRSPIMVAHRPDHLRTQLGGERLDHGPESPVRVRPAGVGQVAGEDDRGRPYRRMPDPVEQPGQLRIAVDLAVQPFVIAHEVGVAEMQQGVVGARVLATVRAHDHGVPRRH